MAEWLKRLIRNQFLFEGARSNRASVDSFAIDFWVYSMSGMVHARVGPGGTDNPTTFENRQEVLHHAGTRTRAQIQTEVMSSECPGLTKD